MSPLVLVVVAALGQSSDSRLLGFHVLEHQTSPTPAALVSLGVPPGEWTTLRLAFDSDPRAVLTVLHSRLLRGKRSKIEFVVLPGKPEEMARVRALALGLGFSGGADPASPAWAPVASSGSAIEDTLHIGDSTTDVLAAPVWTNLVSEYDSSFPFDLSFKRGAGMMLVHVDDAFVRWMAGALPGEKNLGAKFTDWTLLARGSYLGWLHTAQGQVLFHQSGARERSEYWLTSVDGGTPRLLVAFDDGVVPPDCASLVPLRCVFRSHPPMRGQPEKWAIRLLEGERSDTVKGTGLLMGHLLSADATKLAVVVIEGGEKARPQVRVLDRAKKKWTSFDFDGGDVMVDRWTSEGLVVGVSPRMAPASYFVIDATLGTPKPMAPPSPSVTNEWKNQGGLIVRRGARDATALTLEVQGGAPRSIALPMPLDDDAHWIDEQHFLVRAGKEPLVLDLKSGSVLPAFELRPRFLLSTEVPNRFVLVRDDGIYSATLRW